ncbi:MAG: hypothetical protein ACXU8A_05855 [Burkholderiaceae bacterium]
MKFRLFAFYAFAAFSSLLCMTSANAHEKRTIGGTLHVAVGWRNEPAFTDTVNAFDFIVTDPVAVNPILLSVDLLYLRSASPNADIISRTRLTGALIKDFTNPNRFNIWMKPSREGAYGFHIKGVVNGVNVNEIFICGAGTKDPTGQFNCVDDPQIVPQHRRNEW